MTYDWKEASVKSVVTRDRVEWVRVTKRKPCHICNKPDWCTRAVDESVHCCMRVASKVNMRNGGYLHVGESNGRDLLNRPQQRRKILPGAIMNRWKLYTSDAQVAEYANQLGVTPTSLERLGCVRANQHRHAFAFPMMNATGEVVGIRLRHDDGNKSTVKGSRAGLFVPIGLGEDKYLLIAEGPTDTAALLSIGFDVVGRPSCLGQESMVRQLLTNFNPVPEVIVCADGDGVGVDGARKLAVGLLAIAPSVRIIKPPKHKDVREWVGGGASKDTLECFIDRANYWRAER